MHQKYVGGLQQLLCDKFQSIFFVHFEKEILPIPLGLFDFVHQSTFSKFVHQPAEILSGLEALSYAVQRFSPGLLINLLPCPAADRFGSTMEELC